MPNGTLRTVRHERMALFLADEVSQGDAWNAVGGHNHGESVRYRRKILVHPVFITRLEGLMAERAKLLEDPVFGDARWQISQLWRHACSCGDLAVMKESTQMQLRLSQLMYQAGLQETGPENPGNAPEEAVSGRGPGRPPKESAQTKRNPNDIKQLLLDKGVSLADAEPAGEG